MLKTVLLTTMLGAALVTSPGNAATYVYVGHGGGNEIRVLTLDPASGTLAPVETVSFPGVTKPGGSMPLAFSPDQKLLYAAVRGEPLAVGTFKVDHATGKLAHVGTGPLADSMPSIAVDRSGKWLLSASYPGNKIAVNPIGSDGVAQAVSQVVPTDPKAHQIQTDRSNRHVLVPSLGGDAVLQQVLDPATGKLTPNDPPKADVAAGTGPRHLTLSKDERFAYLLGELAGTVTVFAYDAGKGTLKPVQTAVNLRPDGQTENPSGADIHLTPDGRFLYASERKSSTIAAFKVDPANGTITKIGSYGTEKEPRGFNIDPTGKWLVAAGQLSDGLRVHAIDQTTGELSDGTQYAAGKGPDWVEITNLP